MATISGNLALAPLPRSVAAVAGGAKPSSAPPFRPRREAGTCALVTQRVVAAMYRSAGSGGWVALDDPALAAEPEASRPLVTALTT